MSTVPATYYHPSSESHANMAFQPPPPPVTIDTLRTQKTTCNNSLKNLYSFTERFTATELNSSISCCYNVIMSLAEMIKASAFVTNARAEIIYARAKVVYAHAEVINARAKIAHADAEVALAHAKVINVHANIAPADAFIISAHSTITYVNQNNSLSFINNLKQNNYGKIA